MRDVNGTFLITSSTGIKMEKMKILINCETVLSVKNLGRQVMISYIS
jgi:hypothetical protein